MNNGKTKLKKPSKRNTTRFLLNCLVIVLGNMIAAGACALFIEPNGFVMGGATGIGFFVRDLIACAGGSVLWQKWSYIIALFIANVVLFVLGCIFLGKRFAAGTLAGTVLYPAFSALFTLLNDLYVKNEALSGGVPIGMDQLGGPFLVAAFGSVLFGIGVAMVVRVGASTGGTDVPPLIFQKLFGWPISISLWIIDGIIILMQFAVTQSVSAVLYGILITVVLSFIIDRGTLFGRSGMEVKIVSKKHEELRELLLHKIDCGVTVLYGQTGYLQEPCHVLLTIVSRRQLGRLKEEVQKIDPDAFISIAVLSEVRGRGFRSDGVDFLMPKEKESIDTPPDEQNHAEN